MMLNKIERVDDMKRYAEFNTNPDTIFVEGKLGPLLGYKLKRVNVEGRGVDMAYNSYYFCSTTGTMVTYGKGGKAKALKPTKFGKFSMLERNDKDVRFSRSIKVDVEEVMACAREQIYGA
jgi:hypothetical protein